MGRMREPEFSTAQPYYRGCLPARKPRTPTHRNNTTRPVMETTDSWDQPSRYGRPEIPGNHLSGDFTFIEYLSRALESLIIVLWPVGLNVEDPFVTGSIASLSKGLFPMLLKPASKASSLLIVLMANDHIESPKFE